MLPGNHGEAGTDHQMICTECGERFTVPEYIHGWEPHGEFWEPTCRAVCPACGSEEIEEDYGDEE